MKKVRILILDDDPDICFLLADFLGGNGYITETAYKMETALQKMQKAHFDLVLCDYRLEDGDGLEVLKKVKKDFPGLIFIIITGYSDVKTAVKVIKHGAYDYVTKPIYPDEILHTIEEALKKSKANGHKPLISSSVKSAEEIKGYITGESPASKELHRQVDLVAPTDYTVIIYGESGTGKEMIARKIHQKSLRKDGPFIAMDCGAITKELANSELFGHEKGAFTGAFQQKIGHFELANGGTLFLDEVANLSYDVQIALLRVVQEKKLKRIGGSKEIDLDVRIIVASNENLQDAVQKNGFREDLYYRFNEFLITLPPLRERKADIPIFAEAFLKEAAQRLNKTITGFEEGFITALLAYPWYGNLRELRNVIKRTALMTNVEIIPAADLPHEIAAFAPSKTECPEEDKEAEAKAADEADEEIVNVDLKDVAREAEQKIILKVLKQVNHNKTEAAKILNVDRKTLYNKLKDLDIK